MASISISFTHSVQGTTSRTFNLADADLVRMITASKARFDKDGSMTNGQVLTAVAQDLLNHVRADTLRYERDQSVADMTVT